MDSIRRELDQPGGAAKAVRRGRRRQTECGRRGGETTMACASARHQRPAERAGAELEWMQAAEPIIRLEGLEKRYDLGGEVEVRALRGVNLVVNPGSYVAIMGASGSGKSTLLNLIGCLDRPSSGHYFLGGTDVSRMPDDELSEARGARIGFIFQSYNLIAQLTVIENIQVPLLYQGKDLLAYRDRCVKLASMVGLENRSEEHTSQLSGGQQQRVAIARSGIFVFSPH